MYLDWNEPRAALLDNRVDTAMVVGGASVS